MDRERRRPLRAREARAALGLPLPWFVLAVEAPYRLRPRLPAACRADPRRPRLRSLDPPDAPAGPLSRCRVPLLERVEKPSVALPGCARAVHSGPWITSSDV